MKLMLFLQKSIRKINTFEEIVVTVFSYYGCSACWGATHAPKALTPDLGACGCYRCSLFPKDVWSMCLQQMTDGSGYIAMLHLALDMFFQRQQRKGATFSAVSCLVYFCIYYVAYRLFKLTGEWLLWSNCSLRLWRRYRMSMMWYVFLSDSVSPTSLEAVV